MEKKGIIAEFKEFISRGSVIDLAVGIIIGSAFTAIVTSLVNDIIMPAIGCIIGGINFTDLRWVIKAATADTEEAAIYYGSFIQSIVNFLLISLSVFTIVKVINRFYKKKEPAPKEPAEEVLLLREIRDLLKEADKLDATNQENE